jgi:hypothetical protein
MPVPVIAWRQPRNLGQVKIPHSSATITDSAASNRDVGLDREAKAAAVNRG